MIATAGYPYLRGYDPTTLAQVHQLVEEKRLGNWLVQRRPLAHTLRTDRALFDYVQQRKAEDLKSTEPLSKVAFDSKLHVVQNALGTHTTVSRVQGSKLKSKREIRIASLFKDVPEAYLHMIVVHELAHLKERAHDKAFYQLCSYMEPDYHQLEFEVRLYLTHLDLGGSALWGNRP